MYSRAIRAAAYDIAPYIEPDIRNELLSDETSNGLPDVVVALRDSHTPSWLYYYLKKVELPDSFGEELARYVGTDTLNEEAQRQAESEGSLVNIDQPVDFGMTDDMLAPVRENYHEKRDRIINELSIAYQDTFSGELSRCDDPEFLDWLSCNILNDMTLLSWAVLETKAKQQGATDVIGQVAQWCVQRTRLHNLYTAIATFEARFEDDETYLERAVELTEENSLTENPEFVEAAKSDDGREIPLSNPPLPFRDVDVN